MSGKCDESCSNDCFSSILSNQCFLDTMKRFVNKVRTKETTAQYYLRANFKKVSL